jgi:hypothetical protein
LLLYNINWGKFLQKCYEKTTVTITEPGYWDMKKKFFFKKLVFTQCRWISLRTNICQHMLVWLKLRSERGTPVFWPLAVVICWVQEIACFHNARSNFLKIWRLTASCTKWCRYSVNHPQKLSWRTSKLVRPRHYWRFWVRRAAVAVKKHRKVTFLFLYWTQKISKYKLSKLYYIIYINT